MAETVAVTTKDKYPFGRHTALIAVIGASSLALTGCMKTSAYNAAPASMEGEQSISTGPVKGVEWTYATEDGGEATIVCMNYGMIDVNNPKTNGSLYEVEDGDSLATILADPEHQPGLISGNINHKLPHPDAIVGAVATYNELADPDTIYPGQILSLPKYCDVTYAE